MRTVYVVTHPEVTHHTDGVVGGWHDSKLTALGVRDAASIAKALRESIPDGSHVELFSSDLQRARQTANAVSELLGIEPVLDRRLHEKSYGEAEGKPQEWLEERFVPPPAVGDRMEHDEGIRGAETRVAFARRIYAAMAEVLQSRCQQQIIVTHGFAVTFVVASWSTYPASGHEESRLDLPTSASPADRPGVRRTARSGGAPRGAPPSLRRSVAKRIAPLHR